MLHEQSGELAGGIDKYQVIAAQLYSRSNDVLHCMRFKAYAVEVIDHALAPVSMDRTATKGGRRMQWWISKVALFPVKRTWCDLG
jgi:hypothetical protein